MAGCVSEPPTRELDAEAFSGHFAAQRTCKAYIDSLVVPAARKLSTERSPEEIRTWLRDHRGGAFSELVEQVQRKTAALGTLDPRRESDQIKVAGQLFDVLSERPDFPASSCGTDVREFVMESLYLGLGGEDAPVATELRRRGIKDTLGAALGIARVIDGGLRRRQPGLKRCRGTCSRVEQVSRPRPTLPSSTTNQPLSARRRNPSGRAAGRAFAPGARRAGRAPMTARSTGRRACRAGAASGRTGARAGG